MVIKKMETIGPFKKEMEVLTEIHSMVTSDTTPITPIHEETMDTRSAAIMKIVIGLPNDFLKLNMRVFPETMVSLLIETNRK